MMHYTLISLSDDARQEVLLRDLHRALLRAARDVIVDRQHLFVQGIFLYCAIKV